MKIANPSSGVFGLCDSLILLTPLVALVGVLLVFNINSKSTFSTKTLKTFSIDSCSNDRCSRLLAHVCVVDQVYYCMPHFCPHPNLKSHEVHLVLAHFAPRLRKNC